MNWQPIIGAMLGGFLGVVLVGIWYWRDWRRFKQRYSVELDAVLANARAELAESNRGFEKELATAKLWRRELDATAKARIN